ncbi:MAG TPA: mannitol dehydrogenase family protein [Solirubrobacteraceae bacterium]
MTNDKPRLARARARELGFRSQRAPARIVHFGLGNFHRAHQAWYTARAADAAGWGIAAFTGRSPAAARELAKQDGLYTLVERGPSADRVEVVTSLVEPVDGADVGRLLGLFEDAAVALVTITVTEVGYRLLGDGSPDPGDDELAADLTMLRTATATGASLRGLTPSTLLGRLLTGLEARRRQELPPLAVVPCDNVPANGAYVQTGVLGAALTVNPELHEWVGVNVSFVSTSVDRITPRVTREDREQLNSTLDWVDAAPVVTEPFHDWILSGTFPAGRPSWEDAGARYVEDIEPWEQRKLWLLNGAHTLLAFAGLLLGHRNVAEAVNDPWLRSAVELLWADASRQLPTNLDLPAYCAALCERFSNSRIEHQLTQIAEDGTEKLQLRIVPVCVAELNDGRLPAGGALAVAAWIASDAARLADPDRALAALDPALTRSERAAEFAAAVKQGIAELRSRSAGVP